MAMTRILDLAYEVKGEEVDLEQSCGHGEFSIVTLHVSQLRLLATEMGLLKGDESAWRQVATLERRMRVLLDRINRLDDMINAAAQKGHEDLEAESTFSYATWELASEWCEDLPSGPMAGENPAGLNPRDIPATARKAGCGLQEQPGLPLEVC